MNKRMIFLPLCLAVTGQVVHAQHSFTIEGHVPAACNDGVVRLLNEQQIPVDSAVIHDGHFLLSPAGQEPMPQLMRLQVTVGRAADRSGTLDVFPAAGDAIVLDLPAISTRGSLLAAAMISGSSLAQELKEYNDYIRPDGTSPDAAMLPAQIKSFILLHPRYWISLLEFGHLVRTGSVAKAQSKFEGFPPALLHSELGRSVQAAIDADMDKLGPGTMAPDFTTETIDGKPFRLSDLRGHYVLLDFWASWCAPCRLENPNVVENYHRFRDKNFTVLSFSLDENKQSWQQAVNSDHLDWRHVGDLKGWHSDVVKEYKVPSVPRSFLLDPDGRIIATNLRGDELNKTLEKLFQ
jgi:peroxiredoxin